MQTAAFRRLRHSSSNAFVVVWSCSQKETLTNFALNHMSSISQSKVYIKCIAFIRRLTTIFFAHADTHGFKAANPQGLQLIFFGCERWRTYWLISFGRETNPPLLQRRSGDPFGLTTVLSAVNSLIPRRSSHCHLENPSKTQEFWQSSFLSVFVVLSWISFTTYCFVRLSPCSPW